jgi:hypothetical protein
MTVEQNDRRVEDRDRVLHSRLDQMERDHQKLTMQVSALDAALGIVKLEQVHLKEIFEAKLNIIQRGQDLQLSEMKQIAKDISTMAAEPEKTPGGRLLRGEIQTVRQTVDGNSSDLRQFHDWKANVEGALFILKWMGAGGLISLGIWALRLFRIIP